MTMTLVSTVVVGAGGANGIAFTNIPQTGKDLLITFSARSGVNAGNDYLGLLDLNGTYDSAARALRGDGTTTTSVSSTYPLVNTFVSTANTFSNNTIYIPNYTSSVNKTVSIDSVTENNATLAYSWIQTASYATGAVTSLNIGAVIAVGSTASLYTISTTGATGATVA